MPHDSRLVEENVDMRRKNLKNLYYHYGINHLLKVCILISYSFIGAFILYLSEHSTEVENRSDLQKTYDRAKKQLVERIWELKITNFTRAKVANQSLLALDWYEKSLLGTVCQMSTSVLDRPYKWDFWSAVFFTGTVYTTIGYGDITPVTNRGRLITIIYALFGIPVLIFILNDLGIFVSTVLYRVWHFCSLSLAKFKRKLRRLGTRAEPLEPVSNNQVAISRTPQEHLHLLPISFALIFTFFWMLMCSALFCQWESDWTFFDAFYFVFVSLTTIGLGDTVPQRIDYMLMSFGLIIIGLSLVSMCIKVAEAKLDHLSQQMQEKIMQNYQAAQLQGEDGVMDLDVVQKGLNQMEPKWLKPLMRRRNCDLQQIIRQCVKMKIKSTQTDKRTDNRSTQTDFTLIDLQARNKPFDSELIKSFLKEIITWQKEKSGGSAKAKRPNGVINQTSTPTIEPNPNSAEFIPTDNTDRCDTEPDWLASLKFIDTDGEEPLHHWIEEYFCTDEVKKLFRETDARLTECRQLLDNRKLLSPSNTKKQLDPSHMV